MSLASDKVVKRRTAVITMEAQMAEAGLTTRCPSCRRPQALPAEWSAFAATDACGDDHCAWGGDRCWELTDCGIPAEAVMEVVQRARHLKGRRSWLGVPHVAAVPIS